MKPAPLALLASCLAASLAQAAPDFSHVPGVVISHERSPDPFKAVFGKPRYVGSPSLVILPSGHYVACHDLFTRDGGETESVGITKVFRSTDRGRTWRQVSTVRGAFWSTLFLRRRGLFMIGVTKKAGDLVIRRSRDGGETWTRPLSSTRGVLRAGPGVGGAPNRPVTHGGRLWYAAGTTVFSAPNGSPLLHASSWTRTRPPRGDRSTWLGGRFESWGEAQVAASPTEGVVVLPHLRRTPHMGIQRVATPDDRQLFDPDHDFVRLPGGEKKFGATYDLVSGKFWALTNPVLDRHKPHPKTPRDPGDPPPAPGKKRSLVRNTAAIYTSTNLRRWTLDRIFLYHPNVHEVGFQYLDFTFDGPDMIVVSRTAYRVGFWPPPRQHDSNLLTFHRIRDVRVPPADPLPPSLRQPRAKIGGRGL